jgi:hypothetical protein
MVSALGAQGIDACVGNAHHANLDRGWIIALGGMQLLAPHSRIDDTKAALHARWKEVSENPEGEPTKRRDRYKIWLVIIGFLLLSVSGVALSGAHTLRPDASLPGAGGGVQTSERKISECRKDPASSVYDTADGCALTCEKTDDLARRRPTGP